MWCIWARTQQGNPHEARQKQSRNCGFCRITIWHRRIRKRILPETRGNGVRSALGGLVATGGILRIRARRRTVS